MTTTTEHHHGIASREVPDRSSGLDMERDGPNARLQLRGDVGRFTLDHLDELLDWLISTGTRTISITLTRATQIDAALIHSLREPRRRLRNVHGNLVLSMPAPTQHPHLHVVPRIETPSGSVSAAPARSKTR
jgi:hypothetical protein